MISTLQILWAFFLVTFPFGLRFLVFEDWSYRFGNFNPWVSGFVYAPEALLWVVFLGWVIQNWKKFPISNFQFPINFSIFNFLIWIFIFNLLVVSWANGTLVLGALLALRLVEAGIFCLLLRSSLLSFRKTVLFLMIGAGIQFVLGVFQVLLGHSLGLTWFGEPSIATDMVGVAKRNLAADVKQLRAYGTFLHANIFAAYILIVYWVGKFTHGASPKTQNFASLQGAGPPLFFLVAVLGLYFAFSWAAFAMFLGGVVFVFLFQEIKSSTIQRRTMCGLFGLLIVLNMGMIFWQQDVHLPSVKERLEQIQISRSMIVDHPFGVGVGGYTLHMQDYASRRLSPWEFQPVHNVYFLVLNELGIQGLILFLFFFGYYVYRSFFRAPIGSAAVDPYKFVLFFSVLVLASVDHFFWDSWVGLMLATLALLLFKINYYKIQN